jgi:hypothetical protein
MARAGLAGPRRRPCIVHQRPAIEVGCYHGGGLAITPGNVAPQSIYLSTKGVCICAIRVFLRSWQLSAAPPP